MKYGWGNGRFTRALKSARGKAIAKIGRANLIVLENRGLVVVDRKMLARILEALRSHEDADRADAKRREIFAAVFRDYAKSTG